MSKPGTGSALITSCHVSHRPGRIDDPSPAFILDWQKARRQCAETVLFLRISQFFVGLSCYLAAGEQSRGRDGDSRQQAC